MAAKFLGLLAILVAGASAASPETFADINCNSDTEGYSTFNPIGTCACTDHLYIGKDCTEGYLCLDNSGKGCYKKCEPGTFLLVDIANKQWKCETTGLAPLPTGDPEVFLPSAYDVESVGVESYVAEDRKLTKCPVDGFNVCPSQTGTQAPIPDDVTSNPLGICRCNGELWVSEGCSYGFYCNDTEAIGGVLKTCPDNQVLVVDFETSEWDCTDEVAKCPGGQVNGIGCKQPLCLFDKNTLGECGCDTQFFINDECNEAFYCTSNIPDPYLYDGCHQTCLNGQVLLVDAVKKNWECVDRTDYPNYRCPGQFNLNCPKDDIGSGFTSDECNCNGELLVSSDCKEAFYCYDTLENGGRDLQCGTNEIIAVDLVGLRLYCTEDHGECPGLGGMRLGCENNEVIPPELECDFDENTLGECECEGQLMVNEDCTEAFYCSYWTPNQEDGCHLVCDKEKNEIIFVNPATKEWRCRPRPENFICPGKMKVECPRTDGQLWDINCNCKYEIWMNAKCNQAFRCYEKNTGQGNQGAYARCPEGKVIDIDWEDAYKFSCTDELDKCPGSFHFGCDSQDIIDLNTTTEPPTTDAPTDAPTQPPQTTESPTDAPTGAPTDGPTQSTAGPGASTAAPDTTTPEAPGSGSSIVASAVLLASTALFFFVSAL